MFYLRILRYSQVICSSYRGKNYREPKSGYKNLKKLAFVVHFLQTTQDVDISRCWLAEDGKKKNVPRIIMHVHSYCFTH